MAERLLLNTPARVAEAIRTARSELGWSQVELATAAGGGRRFVQDLESGHPRAEIGKVLDVLDALDVQAIALPSVPSNQKRGHVDLKKVVGRG